MKWTRFPDTTRKELRSLISEQYQATIASVAGLTEDNRDHAMELQVRSIAKGIDQNMKNTLVPGDVDPNILNAGMADMRVG